MLKKVIEKLYLKDSQNLAYMDSLTKTNNRTYYDREIRSKYCKIHCYVNYIDVNDLKKVNDTYGHAYGDLLIKHVAKQLHKTEHMELIRMGGDEFILITEKALESNIDGASVGTYKKCKYEDISNGVKKADEQCQRNKPRNQRMIAYDVLKGEPVYGR